MIVIADSSALVAVSTYQGLDWLEPLFGTVLVPTAVYNEVCTQGKPQASQLKAYLDGRVRTVNLSAFNLQKTTGLGAGELEAIALYKAENAQLFLIDDQKAKKSAFANGLETLGSVGLLLLAKEEGLIHEIRSRLTLLEQSEIYLSSKLIEQILQAAGEL
ncbi:MAG: DUF3368 domain-containing protein [Thiolinea sp.]